MNVNEVAGLLGYSKERVETLLNQGVKLHSSGQIVKLACTRIGGAIDIGENDFDAFARKMEENEPGRWPPAGVRRTLLVEAGHVCGICTNGPPLQFHHLLDWAELKHHDERHMIALCPTCHVKCTNGFIDHKSQVQYKQKLLKQIHKIATNQSPYRRIEDSEMRSLITPGEKVGLLALQEEFGCEVRRDVQVNVQEGWLNFHAAVVRSEELVAIEIRELKSTGFAFFQIEHLIKLVTTLKADRFHSMSLYVVVVSACEPAWDSEVETRLKAIADSATCGVTIRMYRLNPLRTKYGI